MRSGDLLIVGQGRVPTLVCSVIETEGNIIRAEVINGLWVLIICEGYMWTEKYGNAIKGKVLYTGPMIKHNGYNDLMHKSEAFLKWGVFKFVYTWKERTCEFFRRIRKAYRAGTKAVHKSWTGKGGWEIDIDDDIPF